MFDLETKKLTNENVTTAATATARVQNDPYSLCKLQRRIVLRHECNTMLHRFPRSSRRPWSADSSDSSQSDRCLGCYLGHINECTSRRSSSTVAMHTTKLHSRTARYIVHRSCPLPPHPRNATCGPLMDGRIYCFTSDAVPRSCIPATNGLGKYSECKHKAQTRGYMLGPEQQGPPQLGQVLMKSGLSGLIMSYTHRGIS